MRFGCIPGTRELRGTSGLDGMLCERAITTETCRHVLGIGKLAALKYESKTDRHTNSTFVKRGLYFQFSGGKFSIAQEFKSPMPGTNTADSSFEPATIGEATEDFTLSNGVIEVKGSHTGTKALRHESSAISPYVSLSLDMSAAPCSVSVPHIDRGDSKSPRYIAVGILKRRAGSTQERIRWMDSGNQMFRRVRTSALEIWPLHKRIFSLKSISGFGLYHCDFNTGHHSTIDIDGRTMKTLSEFYMDYNRNANEEHWTKWVHEKLNNESSDLKQGKYTLELILRWSPLKIILYSLLPVLGSLAVGFAYMQTLISETNSDLGTDLAVIQTAWGLASYIVGAAGGTSLRFLQGF